MLDFTSALYLGLRHGSGDLLPWSSLTSGRPAALDEPPGAQAVARRLAALQGCEAAILAPSTLHLFWDLFVALDCGQICVYLDSATYPVARWGAERSAGRGIPVRTFRHHDAQALELALRDGGVGRRPVVVSDGFCPSCGRAAPLATYLELVRAAGGRVVIDDTQALGVLGIRPGSDAPHGSGGGGSLRHAAIADPGVIVVASLAKAFGAPIAALSGSEESVAAFAARSETRVHASPPSAAAIQAAANALRINHASGDSLRERLARLIWVLRTRLRGAGVPVLGGLFPVQSISPTRGDEPASLHKRLLRAGVRTVLWQPHGAASQRLAFIVTARHRLEHIDAAADALVQAMAFRSAGSLPLVAAATDA
jgi:8-amino-7-oxononanoate synthase